VMKYVRMIALVTLLAFSCNRVAMTAAMNTADEKSGVSSEKVLLDKTWTSPGQKNAADSQVFAVKSLTSPISFAAEGTGLEPATPYGAPHFQSARYARTRAALGRKLHIPREKRGFQSGGNHPKLGRKPVAYNRPYNNYLI
jgi:hypothetical protein